MELDSIPSFYFPICKPVFGLVSHTAVREVKEQNAKETPWPSQCPRRQERPWWKLMTQNEEDEDDSKDGGDHIFTESLVSTIRYRFPQWQQWPYSLFAQISWLSCPAFYNKFNYIVGTVKTLCQWECEEMNQKTKACPEDYLVHISNFISMLWVWIYGALERIVVGKTGCILIMT